MKTRIPLVFLSKIAKIAADNPPIAPGATPWGIGYQVILIVAIFPFLLIFIQLLS